MGRIRNAAMDTAEKYRKVYAERWPTSWELCPICKFSVLNLVDHANHMISMGHPEHVI